MALCLLLHSSLWAYFVYHSWAPDILLQNILDIAKINGKISHLCSLSLCTSPACPFSQAQLCTYKLSSSSYLHL